MKSLLIRLYRFFLAPIVNTLFFHDLVVTTRNFSRVEWLGHPIWQNVQDLWVIQETIAEVKPELLIECGTNRGGSALFYALSSDNHSSGPVASLQNVTEVFSLSNTIVTYIAPYISDCTLSVA